jgi:hypothetical protein
MHTCSFTSSCTKMWCLHKYRYIKMCFDGFKHVNMHEFICVCIHAHSLLHAQKCDVSTVLKTWMHGKSMYKCTHACVYAYKHVNMHGKSMYKCTHACVYAYKHVNMHGKSMYKCTIAYVLIRLSVRKNLNFFSLSRICAYVSRTPVNACTYAHF